MINRPQESLNKRLFMAPFISTVTTDLNPVGLPPIKSNFTDSKEEQKLKKEESWAQKKNKGIISNIQKLKKIQKQVIEENNEKDELKRKKVKETLLKKNNEIEEIRKELYNIDSKPLNLNPDSKFKEKEEAKDNDIKFHPKYEQFKNRLEEVGSREVDELVDFAKNLDFDKYLKDLEFKEAMNLIKIKAEEEAKEEENNKENALEEDNNINEIENHTEKENEKEKTELILPLINPPTTNIKNKEENILVHDREWNVSLRLIIYNHSY